MSQFDTATAILNKLDPHKRVNYTLGLVLGQDEFQQEQSYMVERGRRHSRLLHGYGTVSGLRFSVGDTAAGPEIRVSPGIAVNPRGQEICVPQLMCARLNAWLETHRQELQQAGFAPPDTLNLCVTLCHKECLTDTVPVPGEPCRTQKEALAPSRILDSFELNLCLNGIVPMGSPPSLPSLPSLPTAPVGICRRPSEVEEQGVRAFGTVLSRIEVNPGPPSVSDQQIADAVRVIGPPGSPPPPAAPPLSVRPEDAAARLRTALRVWITEIQPLWNEKKEPAGCEAPPENCVLLGEVFVAVDAGWQVSGGSAGVNIDDSLRPILPSARLLAELGLQTAKFGA